MKKIVLIISIFFFLILLVGCNTNQISNPNKDFCVEGSENGVYICEKRVTSYFDTTISLKLYYSEKNTYNIIDIFDYFEDTLSTYHQYFDKYHEYAGVNNVYTINHSEDPVVISDVLFEAIEFVLEYDHIIQMNNKPLFNIALGPVLNVWHDARESTSCDNTIEFGISYCPVPNDLIDDVVFNTDLNDILLNPDLKTISFAKENMSIDLGGAAKGYVSQIIADYLNSLQIEFLLNTGNSNITAGGINPNNEEGEFYIALTKPNTDFHVVNEYYIYIAVSEGQAIVSSGNDQRFFKGLYDSNVYHHIIDPKTNYPGGYTMNVTVIYPDSAVADIFSTALYLLPVEDAKAFVNSYENLEAIWYNYDGTIEYSDGFSQYIYTPE